MYLLKKQGTLLFSLFLHICSLSFPQAAWGDEFSTTECHCLEVEGGEISCSNNNNNNNTNGGGGGGGLLSMSYYSAAAKTEGYIDIPCRGDCEAPGIHCERTAHKDPGGHEGDEAAFPGGVGFCYWIRKGKGKGDEVLFPVKGEENEGQDRAGNEYTEDVSDIDATQEEVQEEAPISDGLSNMTSAEAPSSSSSSNGTNSKPINWQPLSHKTTRRLNSKSVCVDICSRYYGRAIPDCGTYVLPGPGSGRGRTTAWMNKCKKTSWRKFPDVDAWWEGI